MNPFDLAGPQFVVFYLVLGVTVLFVLRAIRLSREAGDGSTPRLSDPYLIAYLRGGKKEALSVAAISLLDRNLLTGTDKLATANAEAVNVARRPIERAILERFRIPADADVLFSDPGLSAVAEKYESQLVEMRLLPDRPIKRLRTALVGLAILLLWGTAFIKIAVALTRGRTNIVFLIILAAVFAIAANVLLNPRRTRAGDALLDDLKTLFGGLKDRSGSLSRGGQSNEAAFLAAVFGVSALPLVTFPFVSMLRPRPTPGDASSCSSWTSSGSSCGSSCGGSCGGGCGGCGS
jgi:uncharacterized protein (TIGR04222 family)